MIPHHLTSLINRQNTMIKILNLILLTLNFWLFFPQYLAASPSLLIDQDFNVLSVNGKSFSDGFFSADSTVKLISGVNKIALEYEAVFEQEDDFDLVKSEVLLITFYAQHQDQYRLTYLKPSNARAARKFAGSPKLSIVSPDGNPIKFSSYFLASKSEGFVNQQTRPSLVGQPAIKITSKSNKPKSKAKQQPNPEERLEYWWRKATKQQRQSFLKKVSDKQ